MPFFDSLSSFFSSREDNENASCAPPERSVATATPARESFERALSLDCPPDSFVRVGEKTFQYHAGSGYFGLAAHPEVLAAACEATLRYGVGTATTRAALTSPPVFEVERRIAGIMGTARAFYTASGYTANQIIVDVLSGTFDRIFIDESAHSSLYDAIRGVRDSRLRPQTFRHNSPDDLHEKLRHEMRGGQKPLVITDGVFSIFGDVAPLREYETILSHYDGASIIVDDAHGFGVLGMTGCGTLEHFGIEATGINHTLEDGDDFFDPHISESPVRFFASTTMSKGLGGYGGIIAGTERFIERLAERSRIFAGASAPPPPIAAATAKSLAILFDDDQLRSQLDNNSRLLRSRLTAIGLKLNAWCLPMVSLSLGSALNMRRIQRELSQRGILIAYLPRHPGLGSEGALRIAVFATHTPEMIERLVNELAKCI